MDISPHASSPPLRVALAQMSPEASQVLVARLSRYAGRVEVLHDPHGGSDLVLVDPYADTPRFDPRRFAASVTGLHQLVVYTEGDPIDPLAFAMTGAALAGRLRGWLWTGLSDEELVAGLEQIHAGHVLVRGRDDEALAAPA